MRLRKAAANALPQWTRAQRARLIDHCAIGLHAVMNARDTMVVKRNRSPNEMTVRRSARAAVRTWKEDIEATAFRALLRADRQQTRY